VASVASRRSSARAQRGCIETTVGYCRPVTTPTIVTIRCGVEVSDQVFDHVRHLGVIEEEIGWSVGSPVAVLSFTTLDADRVSSSGFLRALGAHVTVGEE
jgi:hypothetical protein